jgi:aldehyde dehydrogenase (NAD+)
LFSSPCLIAEDTDLSVTAKRIAWGKYMNAGQTCIAPDYVLCPRNLVEPFIAHLKAALLEFYGPNVKQVPDSYSQIINEHHMTRLLKLLEENEAVKVPLLPSSEIDELDRIMPPFSFNVSHPEKSSLMEAEIFGPFLPILPIDNIGEGLAYISRHDKPLALYLFTNDKAVVERVIKGTTSGGLCINDVIMHTQLNTLPFGGVGPSGLGQYHGKATFDTFSHLKSVQWTGQGGEWLNASRYPPLTPAKLSFLHKIMFSSTP